jgi:hypothetical protein
MDLKRIASSAKGLFEKRGGADSLKEDAAELKDVARGEGSLADKAKAAAEALKEPGADEPVARTEQPQASGPAEGRPRRGRRRQHGERRRRR